MCVYVPIWNVVWCHPRNKMYTSLVSYILWLLLQANNGPGHCIYGKDSLGENDDRQQSILVSLRSGLNSQAHTAYRPLGFNIEPVWWWWRCQLCRFSHRLRCVSFTDVGFGLLIYYFYSVDKNSQTKMTILTKPSYLYCTTNCSMDLSRYCYRVLSSVFRLQLSLPIFSS